MKSINLVFLMFLLALVGCNLGPTSPNQEAATTETSGVTDAAVAAQPTNFFFQAIDAFEAGNQQEATVFLQSGIDALTKEGMVLEGEQKKNLDTALASLESAKQQLQQGKLSTVEDLKQLIIAAEAFAPHKLLTDLTVVKPNDQ